MNTFHVALKGFLTIIITCKRHLKCYKFINFHTYFFKTPSNKFTLKLIFFIST